MNATMRSRRRRRTMSRSLAFLENSLISAAAVANVLLIASQRTRMRTSHRGTTQPGRTFRKRYRRSVKDIYNELGDIYFRRAYRMKYSTFTCLAKDLHPGIVAASGKKGIASRYASNGQIASDVRLACALRWFAGGSPYDVMTTYGIGHTDAINSIWHVVDAVNRHPKYNIAYPDDHNKQRSIARGFQRVSKAGFDCCAGAVDGILIWTHKPSPKDCDNAGCSSGKFLCGRKKKFGLNCQAVCDVRGRILDLSIRYPGSTSDCLAFEGMSLFHRLEAGILAPGLCLFGDNAYLNTPYMATPYAAVSGGTKDSYNFYHSQLRIRIECTFGILTHRWAILRRAIPVNITIQKTVALVIALAKLHNFCIDADDGNSDLASTANDEWNTELNGGVPMVDIVLQGDSSEDAIIPEQLLDVGHHNDDIGGSIGRYNRQRRYNNISDNSGVPLPRDRLHSYIETIGMTRPTPLRRQ